MTSEREKADLGAQTIGAFLSQFGNPSDPATGIFLGILLKELFDAKVVSLLGKPQKAGDQAGVGIQWGLDRDLTSHGPEPIGPTSDVANPDIQDN